MRKTNVTLTFVLCLFFFISRSQGIGIGTDQVDASAILELKSTSKGLLLPRVEDHTSVSSPKDGLVVYDKTDSSFFIHSGGDWLPLSPMPKGGIIMWSGTKAPKGWALCDGENKTPDLSGRFIVGYSDSDDYNKIGNTGGVDKVELTEDDLPKHRHTIPTHTHNVKVTLSNGAHKHEIQTSLDRDGSQGDRPARTTDDIAGGNGKTYYTGSNYNSSTIESDDGDHIHTVTVSENNAPNRNTGYIGDVASPTHENRPPYYVLAFIMKL